MSELYQLLSSTADSTGLPVMNTSLFLETVEKYGREEFRKVLADYITKEKPAFPFFEFDQNKVVESFHKLKQADYTKYIMNSDKEVIEKYDDYKYSYAEYGLGVIEGPSTFNYVSDSFMNDLRMACGSYGFKSAVQ